MALTARWLARTLPRDNRIVAVFPDGPQRYVGTVFNDDYCREHQLLGHLPCDDPDEITGSSERTVSRWTRCTSIADPLERPEHDLTGAAQ